MDSAAFARALQVAALAALDIGLALAIGATALLDPWRRNLTRLLQLGLALLFGGALLLLWWQAAAMGDVPLDQAASEIAPMLRQSHVGHAWLLGVVALLVAAGAAWTARAARPGRVQAVLAVALAVFIGSRSSVSHLGSDGVAWRLVVQGLHLAATALWAGVVCCGVVLLRVPGDGIERLVGRLSTLATWALGVIVASGVTMAWLSLRGTLPAALQSDYLRWLALKLLLVAVAAGLGAYNRFAVLPSLARAAPERADVRAATSRFARILRIEAVVLLLVLVLAALLASSAPPGSA